MSRRIKIAVALLLGAGFTCTFIPMGGWVPAVMQICLVGAAIIVAVAERPRPKKS
jgi:hypothetical protein